MSAHTKGPWAIDWNVSRIDVFSSDAATLIATIRRSTPSDGIDADARANARLIAEAGTVATETGLTPRQLAEQRKELLEALCDLAESVRAAGITGPYLDAADAAIAKATGATP